MHEYTDIENTGLPAVPDLSGRADPLEMIDEAVWSHRIDRPTTFLAPSDSTSTDR